MGKRNNARKAAHWDNQSVLGSMWGNLNLPEMRQSLRINQYMKLIEMLAVSRFKWINLPPYIDERYLELTLFENGLALFFPDGRKGVRRFMVTSGNIGGVNNYNNPTSFQPVATNYSHPQIGSKKCVPIWDNQLRCTMIDVMWNYATRLAIADRALDVNLDNISVPLIIATSETNKLTAQNLMKAREDGDPYIYVYDTADITGMFQTFPNMTPFLADKIITTKTQIWNELVNYLGIDNSTTEKKERLLESEVTAGNSRTNVFRLSYLKARQQACDTINRLWPQMADLGKPISIEWNDTTSGGLLDVDGNKEEEN